MTRRLPLRPPQPAPKNRRLLWLRLGRALLVTVCTLAALISLFGVLANPGFSVDPELRVGLTLSGLSVGFCVGLLLMYLNAQLPRTPAKKTRPGARRDLSPQELQILTMLVAIPVFGYVPVAQGLPWLLNRQLGQDTQWVSQVHRTGLSHSKNAVSYHVQFEPLANCDITALPITEGEFKTAQPGDRIELAGRLSRFACVIDQHHLIATPTPSPVLKQ